MVKENNKKKMLQNYECKFCGAKFHREVTLSTHMCVKKQRYLDSDNAGVRMGFRVFQRFYEISVNSKKPKTLQEFIDSSYYTGFAKFGHYLVALKPLYIDQFIDSLIKNSVPLVDWTNEIVYYTYVADLVKREPADAGTERTITEIAAWCESNNAEFSEFFLKISANEAAHMIRGGKISPWVLYLSRTGGDLLDRFNADHAKIIGTVIDAGFWMKKFKNNEEDVEFIKNLLDQAGI